MRGARCKKLKNEFAAKYGRYPAKTTPVDSDDPNVVAYMPSQWRRLKKAYMQHRRGNV